MDVRDVRLEPEQIEIIRHLVEAHLRVTTEKRDSFYVLNDSGGTHVIHHGLRDWQLELAHSDLEVLALTDLVYVRTDMGGRITRLTVLPRALDYYEALSRREGAFDPDGDEPFTKREIALIDEGLDRVRAHLRAANVPPDQMTAFERRLDFLARAARRYGRLGWRIVAGHLIWDIAVAATFAPERAEELLRELLVGIGGLLPG